MAISVRTWPRHKKARADLRVRPSQLGGFDASLAALILSSGVQRAAMPPEMGRHNRGACIDGCIHPLFGDQVSAFFGNPKPQRFSFGINEPGIGL